MTDDLTTLSLLTLAQTHRGDVVRQINRRVQFLKMVQIRPGAGQNCAWAVEADGALVESYSEGADAENFGGDVQDQAILTWGLYRANPHVTQLAMDAAATAFDPEGNKALWARTIANHAAKLAAHLNVECYSGAGTTGLVCGLDEAIGKDDNTYATINRSTGGNEYWQPYVGDEGSDTPIDFTTMREDVREIYEKCGENPDVAMTTPTLFNAIGGLFDDTRRNIEVANTARGPVRLDFGFRALELDGMVIVKDKDATAKTIYYLQTAEVEFLYLPSPEQRMLLNAMNMQVQADDGFGEVPLGFVFEMLSKTGASDKAQIRSTCQLRVRRPNTCGVRKNAVAPEEA